MNRIKKGIKQVADNGPRSKLGDCKRVKVTLKIKGHLVGRHCGRSLCRPMSWCHGFEFL